MYASVCVLLPPSKFSAQPPSQPPRRSAGPHTPDQCFQARRLTALVPQQSLGPSPRCSQVITGLTSAEGELGPPDATSTLMPSTARPAARAYSMPARTARAVSPKESTWGFNEQGMARVRAGRTFALTVRCARLQQCERAGWLNTSDAMLSKAWHPPRDKRLCVAGTEKALPTRVGMLSLAGVEPAEQLQLQLRASNTTKQTASPVAWQLAFRGCRPNVTARPLSVRALGLTTTTGQGGRYLATSRAALPSSVSTTWRRDGTGCKTSRGSEELDLTSAKQAC